MGGCVRLWGLTEGCVGLWGSMSGWEGAAEGCEGAGVVCLKISVW